MKFLLFTICLFFASISYAQQYYTCKDSSRIPNTYVPCGTDYQPVCGCDNVTYRNECAASNWGGLSDFHWTTNTVCGNFDFDFYPTEVDFFPATFNIFMKTQGSAEMYIYNLDAFGRLEYTDYFYTSSPGEIKSKEIPVQNLLQGIYAVVVVVNGEKQYKKFAKIATFQ